MDCTLHQCILNVLQSCTEKIEASSVSQFKELIINLDGVKALEDNINELNIA